MSKFYYQTPRAVYVWDTEHPYTKNAEKISVYKLGEPKPLLIDAWGCVIKTIHDFYDAVNRREELQKK